MSIIIFIDFCSTPEVWWILSLFSLSIFMFTGNWILERSIDGVTFEPWQYYAITDTECLTRFNVNPRKGPPSYTRDDEVICTSFYSKIHPLENGEVPLLVTDVDCYHCTLVHTFPSDLSCTYKGASIFNFSGVTIHSVIWPRLRCTMPNIFLIQNVCSDPPWSVTTCQTKPGGDYDDLHKTQ